MRQEAERKVNGRGRVSRRLGVLSLAAGMLTATAAAAGSFLFNICPMCTPYRLDETTPAPAGEQAPLPAPEEKVRGDQSQLPPLRQDVRGAG